MFNTLRSKIAIITLGMLAALVVVLSCYSYLYLKHAKSLTIQGGSHATSVIAQGINREIVELEDNSKDLALMGSLFYKAGKDKQIAKQTVVRIFENYDDSLGGGIWFKPYQVSKNEKRFCIYAYRNKDNQVVLDENFNSDEYNYPEQKWYKEISAKVTKSNNVAWSSPYYEKQGSNTLMITVGSGIYDDNGSLIGISTVDWEIETLTKRIANIKPTQNTFSLFADKENDYILVSTDKYLDNKNLIGKSLKNIPWYRDDLKQRTYMEYKGKKYIPYVKNLENGMFLIVNIPKDELFYSAVISVTVLFIALMFINIVMAILLYIVLRKYIMRPIYKLTEIAHRIGKGETDIKIKVEKPEEFVQLASTFDKMITDIKQITKERVRINSELSIAKSIQASSLPDVFPPFPDRKEFDIFASMQPAKEVGGDFYDFYFIDDDNFMFLIADVSGKGIPAALFMMTVKTLVNNMAQVGYSPKELIETINDKVCASNKQGFFVTMLIGIVNVNTGEISYINCGHNQPLIKSENGEYKYLELDSNIVIGAFENSKFNIHEAKLKKGDTIFLYTDGITEALNSNNEIYGEQNLLESINKSDCDDIETIAEKVKGDVINYMGTAEQSDDITMLIFKYKNEAITEKIKIYKNLAVQENYKPFYDWLHRVCDEWKLSDTLINKIDMSAEEIYANIMFYSYPKNSGIIEVTMSKYNDKVTIKFEDEGVPYNPLEKPDPDITLPPEERPLGGLGIFMVKEMTDNMDYEYKNNRNILTLTFML